MRRPAPPQAALALAALAGAALAAIAVRHPADAAQAWLAAYLFWAGLPVGALFLALSHGLTGGAWGLTLRPALAAMLRTMPLLALFLVPVLLAARQIYPWAAGGGEGWLRPWFFAARAVAYAVLWNAIALGVLRRARPDGRLAPAFAWPALILLFFSTGLAALDWLMSLEPGWTSTIFGLMVTAGWTLAGAAAALALTAALTPPERAEPLDAPARIVLALVFLWAYLSVVQLIVIWESDLSREIPWYLRRLYGFWGWAGLGFAVFAFAAPFLILIWQKLRRSRPAVLAAAGAIVAAHLVESLWLSLPDFGRPPGWADVLAVVAIGAAFFFAGGRDFRALPVRSGDAGG